MKSFRRKYAFSQDEGRWEMEEREPMPRGICHAEIWGAVIIGGAALGGAYLSSQGAKKAAGAASASGDAAIAEQRRQFDTLLSLTAPQRAIGNQAFATLGSIYGYSPTAGGGNLLTGPSAGNGLYQPTFAAPNVNDTARGRALTYAFNPGGATANMLGVKSGSSLDRIFNPLGGMLGGLFGSKHGDERRNVEQFLRNFPVQDLGNGMLMLPDGTQFPQDQLQELAGTWYGAVFHPDGDQAGWQQRYEDVLAGIKANPVNANVGQAGGGLTSEGVPQGVSAGPVTVDQQGNVLSGPDYSAFFKSPDYNFRLKEGLSAVQNSAAAEGGLYSGNALRGITEYGQGLASSSFNDYVKNQLALAGIGTGATSQAAQGALTTGANIGNLLIDQGNARASGIIGQSNSWANLINQLGQLGGYKFGNALGG